MTKRTPLNITCYFLAFIAAFAANVIAEPATQPKITVELTLPQLDAHPYHKPFVAVWLETTERQPVETIAIWYDDAEWLKDLRQWWRKLGRKQHASNALDGLSGATQKPGTHTITWQGETSLKQAFLNIEVSREEGGRSYHREAIDLTKAQTYDVAASHEYGATKITVKP